MLYSTEQLFGWGAIRNILVPFNHLLLFIIVIYILFYCKHYWNVFFEF